MKKSLHPPPRAARETILVALRWCMIKRATLSFIMARAIVAFPGGSHKCRQSRVLLIRIIEILDFLYDTQTHEMTVQALDLR